MPANVPGLPRVDWHRFGALGSLVTQAIIGLAALTAPAAIAMGTWVWYLWTLLAIGATYAVVHRLRSSWWFLAWPVLCLFRIMTFVGINHQAGQLVIGLMTICFLFAGLTQPQFRSLLMLPLAGLTLIMSIDVPLQQKLFRLSIAMLIWTVSSELPAYLLRQLAAKQDLLITAARTDVLTGARNRYGLAADLTRMQGRAFLVIIDLDSFKAYNDRYGHTAGDGVLKDFAGMLHQQTRKQDVVVRYGGEEFLVLLADVEQATAETVVDRWAHSWRGHSSGVTFSAGITDLADDDSVSMADAAMYDAKSQGRDRAVVKVSVPVAAGPGSAVMG